MTVELHDAVDYSLVDTAIGTLKTDGTLSVTFNNAAAGSYYIAVKGSNLVQVNEDLGQYSEVWATGISKGNTEESAQNLTFTVTTNNDVLFEEVHYKNIIELPINSTFCIIENDLNRVRVPNFNNIIGDKLTAFAPNTTGIPYL